MSDGTVKEISPFTEETKIADVKNDSVFDGYGRLLFPANTGDYSGDTLGNLSLTWYSGIQPKKTVEITNDLYNHAAAGKTIFYDIYTDAEASGSGHHAVHGAFRGIWK